MEVMPDPLITLSIRGIVHVVRENIDIGMYYYIAVYDYTDDGSINDCEYVGRVLSKTADELTIEMRWKRLLINGNEQEWAALEPENLTFHWLDVDAPHVRPCIRFYHDVWQS